jgi:hypothetical protein
MAGQTLKWNNKFKRAKLQIPEPEPQNKQQHEKTMAVTSETPPTFHPNDLHSIAMLLSN